MAKKAKPETIEVRPETIEVPEISPVQKATALVEEAKANANAALLGGSVADYSKSIAELKKRVDDLNIMLKRAEYEKFLETPNPIIAAVKQFSYVAYRIKETRDKETDAITGVLVETNTRRIDLADLVKYGELDKAWLFHCAELRALFHLRSVHVFEITSAMLAKESFFFSSQARKKANGETPDSNTQIVRLIQTIIDEAIFVDDGTGKNAYKCTNHDIAFIEKCFSKLDVKEKCTIATINDRQFQMVMMSVFEHCLGEAYKVKSTQRQKKNA